MRRYIAERTFSDGLHIPIADGGADVCRAVVDANAREGVTWVHSYVSEDKVTTYCVYDAPSPERSARRPRATCCPSIASPRSGCSIRTSTSSPINFDTPRSYTMTIKTKRIRGARRDGRVRRRAVQCTGEAEPGERIPASYTRDQSHHPVGCGPLARKA